MSVCKWSDVMACDVSCSGAGRGVGGGVGRAARGRRGDHGGREQQGAAVEGHRGRQGRAAAGAGPRDRRDAQPAGTLGRRRRQVHIHTRTHTLTLE